MMIRRKIKSMKRRATKKEHSKVKKKKGREM
jgi:hypothetical protein